MNNIWIVLQQEPLETIYFEDLQRFIIDKHPGAPMYSADRLHMTLFHFGFPSIMYKDIKRSRGNLSYQTFEASLGELMQELHEISNNEIMLSSTGIVELFGSPHDGKVVLRFENTLKLKKKRSPYIEKVYYWMEGLGIKDPETFMENSRNFKHNGENSYKPHVTLGYAPKGFARLIFPEKKIRFTTAYLFNFDKLF